jgi:hypothetical protein
MSKCPQLYLVEPRVDLTSKAVMPRADNPHGKECRIALNSLECIPVIQWTLLLTICHIWVNSAWTHFSEKCHFVERSGYFFYALLKP